MRAAAVGHRQEGSSARFPAIFVFDGVMLIVRVFVRHPHVSSKTWCRAIAAVLMTSAAASNRHNHSHNTCHHLSCYTSV